MTNSAIPIKSDTPQSQLAKVMDFAKGSTHPAG
jgi:hypothetical protein